MDVLIDLARKEDINIVYLPLLNQRESLWGMYVPKRPGNKATIYMDSQLKENPNLYRLARCVLSEELGHHFTGVFSYFSCYKVYPYSLKRKMSADDKKALQWATNMLVPTAELISLITEDGICECVDLAGYFGVTAWFMYRKMEFLQYQVRAKRPEICLALNWGLVSQVKISCIY